MRKYFNYFTEVEEYFVRKRGKNVLVAPLDWRLIELWKENGVPLHVVLRGIDRSFESTQKRGKKNPTTLFYCHPAVMEAFEEYGASMVGAHGEESPPEVPEAVETSRLMSCLDRFALALEGSKVGDMPRAANRLRALCDEVKAGTRTAAEEWDRELGEIQVLLVAELKCRVDSDRLSELQAQVREETRIYKKHLSKEMYERLQERCLQRLIMSEFHLPEFSLLATEPPLAP